MATVLEIRKALVDRGYVPIPVENKVPVQKEWQKTENVSDAMLDMWTKVWPRANNTGILTKFTPTLDADILNEPAAIAIEDLVRERFEERGYILPRIGKPPKRAIPFRTSDPFPKLTANLIAAKGSTGEKIEFMCDGQQIVAAGIHPDTGKEYSWPLGNPTEIAHDDLPDISQAEAQKLVEDIVELLCRDFGYTRAAGRPLRKGNGAPGDPVEDWQKLVDDIRAGIDLHANTRDLIAKMVRSGMDGGAIVNFVRGLMNSSAAPRDERWQRRYDDLPRLVDTAQAKFERATAGAPAGSPSPAASVPATPAPAPGSGSSGPPPQPPPSQPASATSGPGPGTGPKSGSLVDALLQTFERWLILSDPVPIYATLGAVAANLLEGDPVWLGIIAPPSSAKTELLNSLMGLPYVHGVSTLTQASLLSGTPRRQQTPGAKGGLLRQFNSNNFGIIVLKDFGSILSMRTESKAEILAALREIYDGAWTRHLGSDGGRTLEWKGKAGLIFGCPGVIDSHYSVISSLGDRFLLSRMTPDDKTQLGRAFDHRGGKTKRMRDELMTGVSALFSGTLQTPSELDVGEDDFRRLNETCRLAVRLRGPVDRVLRTREIESVHGAEGTARIGLALERLLCGMESLGIERGTAMDVVLNVAMDSVPPLRRAAYCCLREQEAKGVMGTTARDVAITLKLPTTTVRRGLEELAVYGLARRDQGGKADLWVALPLP